MTSHSPARPLRADARRNRAKLLEAARAAFAQGGLDAQMEDVARRAGLGVGTLYRHFPTKDTLVEALSAAHFERLADILEAHAQAGGPATERLKAALREVALMTSADVAMCEIISRRPEAIFTAAAQETRKETATAALLAQARAEGGIRDDACVNDVGTIMCGFGHLAAQQQAGADLDCERYLTIAIAGLCAR